MPKKTREADKTLENEKKRLDALYRESPVVIGAPFRLNIDWFMDTYSGGSELKTWAGQQCVFDIARDMRGAIRQGVPTEDCLMISQSSDAVPFNFDCDLGGIGSDRDLGFSLDPLKNTGMRLGTRPLLEFAAFVGLQRFRPLKREKGSYEFALWSKPMLPEAAGPVVCGAVRSSGTMRFGFRLLYRTKYLKTLLPAHRA
jgi:CRISPR-associated protein Csb3